MVGNGDTFHIEIVQYNYAIVAILLGSHNLSDTGLAGQIKYIGTRRELIN